MGASLIANGNRPLLPVPLTVIMHLRVDGQPERMRNARAALIALNDQTLDRNQYQIILVEQGASPKAGDIVGNFIDDYIFAFNEGPYNRSWAFNIGACRAGEGMLCFIDADVIIPRELLSRCREMFTKGVRALSPYETVLYLDHESTDRVIECLEQHTAIDPGSYGGDLVRGSVGGCICVEARLYREIGGHDERFRGWGREDREFWVRLSSVVTITRLPEMLLHVDHHQRVKNDEAAEHNRQLWSAIQKGEAMRPATTIGDPLRYAGERLAGLKH